MLVTFVLYLTTSIESCEMIEDNDSHLEKDANEDEHKVVNNNDPQCSPEVATSCVTHAVRRHQCQTAES